MVTMHAVVRTRYGAPDVLHPAELPMPEPGQGEIRVRVRHTSVNYGDLTARNFSGLTSEEFNMPAPLFYAARLGFGWSRPRNPLLGSEYAGVVDAVGEGVTRWTVGDRVFGYRGQRMGAYAAYLVEKADGMVAGIPEGVPEQDAAVLAYGGTTALGLLRPLGSFSGGRVMIVGASGSIGMAALQILASDGARVTAVAGPRNQELVQGLGAEAVLDYTRVRVMEPGTAGTEPYDLILDVRGRAGFDAARAILSPQGIYAPVSFKSPALLQAVMTRGSLGQKVVVRLAPEDPQHLKTLSRLMAAGRVRAAVGRSFDLADAARAHRAAEAGATSGHVLLNV
jgi:NADPH:quinone reductase-like Zn-dependent oxidoreductase